MSDETIHDIVAGPRKGSGLPVSEFVAFVGVMFCIYAVVLVSTQCWYWLQKDEWVSISVLDLVVGHPLAELPTVDDPLRRLVVRDLARKNMPLPIRFVPSWQAPRERGWLLEPHSWFGLHRVVAFILRHLPLSLAAFALGMVLFYFGAIRS